MVQIVFQDGNAHPKRTAAFRWKLVTTAKCFGKINCQISKSVSCSWLSMGSAVIVVRSSKQGKAKKDITWGWLVGWFTVLPSQVNIIRGRYKHGVHRAAIKLARRGIYA